MAVGPSSSSMVPLSISCTRAARDTVGQKVTSASASMAVGLRLLLGLVAMSGPPSLST
jgi:hypothetical protein